MKDKFLILNLLRINFKLGSSVSSRRGTTSAKAPAVVTNNNCNGAGKVTKDCNGHSAGEMHVMVKFNIKICHCEVYLRVNRCLDELRFYILGLCLRASA